MTGESVTCSRCSSNELLQVVTMLYDEGAEAKASWGRLEGEQDSRCQGGRGLERGAEASHFRPAQYVPIWAGGFSARVAWLGLGFVNEGGLDRDITASCRSFLGSCEAACGYQYG